MLSGKHYFPSLARHVSFNTSLQLSTLNHALALPFVRVFVLLLYSIIFSILIVITVNTSPSDKDKVLLNIVIDFFGCFSDQLCFCS